MSQIINVFKELDINKPVKYVETLSIKDGVECDVYEFIEDKSIDLAIVRVKKGSSTPLQRVLSGTKTIEGHIDGEGTFTITNVSGIKQVYSFGNDATHKPMQVKIGECMQWIATTDLTFFEICDPPYEDGRFENIKE